MSDDIYLMTDETSIHVFEGIDFVGIYDHNYVPEFKTGFPRLDNELTKNGTLWAAGKTDEDEVEDKEWARNRNREIELEIRELREILDYNGAQLKPERVKKIEEEIENLLEERDDNTYRFELAGKEFERLYLEKKESMDGLEKEDLAEEPLKRTYGPNYQEARFRNITDEMTDLYLRKNKDYGNSFDKSLDEDGLLVSKIRLRDKLNRFSKLVNSEAEVEDETIRDTLVDMANYAIMTVMWMDESDIYE